MSALPEQLRLLICAPDLLTRAGLAAMLGEQPGLHIVGQVAPTDDMAAQLTLYQPEIVLWDSGWTPEESLEALIAVLEDGIPTLVLASSPEAAADLWAAGARNILLRDSDSTLLTIALQAVAQHLVVMAPAAAEFLPLIPAISPTSLPELLTPRELEVLQLVAQGLSNKLIARQLGISEHTVKFHMNAILGKLGVQSRTEAVVYATRAGLILL
ncbi:MAG: response regulator transcription factor [Caldilineaceae bacterium]